MPPAPTSGTAAGYRSAAPAAVCPAEAAAVVSGTLPRGAIGADCGGLSNPGRTLAAYSWLASAASSAALMGKSLSASTARYSLVGMELVYGDLVEHGQRVVGQNSQRRVERDQISRDCRFVDTGESHRQPRRLLADQARLEQAHHALPLLAGTHQDELGLALLHRHLVRRNQRNTTPGDELRPEQADDHRRYSPVGGLPAERRDAQRVRQEEAGGFPDPGDQRVEVVGRRSTAQRLDGLLGSRLGQQAVLGAAPRFVFFTLLDRLDGQPQLLCDLVVRAGVEVGDPGVDIEQRGDGPQRVLARAGLVVHVGLR